MSAIIAAIRSALSRMTGPALTKVLGWFSTATGVVVTDAEAMLAYIKNNPLSAALAAEALTRFGSEEDIQPLASITPNQVPDPQAQELLRSLGNLRKQIDAGVEDKVIGLGSTTSDISHDVVRKELVQTAMHHFGSLDQFEKVREAIMSLSQSDIEWAQAMGIAR
jgi:hypothetical protein